MTHKTADETVDAYNFTADQRVQLAELLAEENRSMWSSALYGIGVGDREIVVVALSQLGNVGGQPYWSWYGFNSRVEWWRLLCQLVHQRVRVSGCWRDPQDSGLYLWL